MGVTQTLKLLDELQKLGFSDDAFWRLHHKREPTAHRRQPQRETIKDFRRYCEGRQTFDPFGENARVHERLVFVMSIYTDVGFAANEPNVFIALAEASFKAIPTYQKDGATPQ